MDLQSNISDLWWTFANEYNKKDDLRIKAERFIVCIRAAKNFFDQLSFKNFLKSIDKCEEINVLCDCYARYHDLGDGCEFAKDDAIKDFRNMLAEVLPRINFDLFDYEWLIMEYHERVREAAEDATDDSPV